MLCLPTILISQQKDNCGVMSLISHSSPLISRKATGITRPAAVVAAAPLGRPLEEVTPSQNIEEFDSPDIPEPDVPAGNNRRVVNRG